MDVPIFVQVTEADCWWWVSCDGCSRTAGPFAAESDAVTDAHEHAHDHDDAQVIS